MLQEYRNNENDIISSHHINDIRVIFPTYLTHELLHFIAGSHSGVSCHANADANARQSVYL